MNAGAWNTNVHKQAIVKLSEEKAPIFHKPAVKSIFERKAAASILERQPKISTSSSRRIIQFSIGLTFLSSYLSITNTIILIFPL